jgi:hypothetical protein
LTTAFYFQDKVNLEKADIMDVAVKYIEDIQRKQILEGI